jgi:integrase/recombinase XerD
MANPFNRRKTIAEKVPQTRANLLATKLAILFQSTKKNNNGMQRYSSPRSSLFSATGTRKYLTAAERRRFQQAIEGLAPVRRLFCAVLLWSGGRVSEVLALTPDAIDLEGGDIVLVTLKRRQKGVIRQIPLPRSVVDELSNEFQIQARQADPGDSHTRLWPWSRTTAWRLVKKVMATAGITTHAASPKGLRHTFGVSAFQVNVPPHLVQRWLGHASLRTTSIYGDVLGEEERRFAARMWQQG